MAKLIGFTILIFDVIFGLYWAARGKPHNEQVRATCFAIGFLAIILIIASYFTETEISTPLGTLKGTVEKIKTDAKQIEEVRKRIEAQSATVDLVAKQASESKALYEELNGKMSIVNKKIEELEKIIKEASKTSSDLQIISEFTMIVTAAQNDDRGAFDQLKKWSEDKNYQLNSFANKAVKKIIDLHNPPLFMSEFRIPWKDNVDPNKLTLAELKEVYKRSGDLKPAILEFIWKKRKDIPKKEKMQFLIDLMKEEKSLTTLEYVGRYFAEGADLKIKPLAVEYFLDWWEKNKESIN